MKPSTRIGIPAAALFAFVALPLKTIAQQSSATSDTNSKSIRYTILDLGPVGPLGQPFMIANNGLVAGLAATQNGSYHATLWFSTQELDIGTPGLGGPNSFAFGVNDIGEAVGAAQTADSDNEDFCGFNALGFTPSNTSCLPFIWRYGAMHPLPTLGGPNGYGYMINDGDEVVGFAENPAQDQGCPVHQFLPVVWKHGKPQALPMPDGDSYGLAAYINEKGQAVGASGTCGPFNPVTFIYLVENHPLLWDSDGTLHELQTLGGAGGLAGNHACAINNLGQAVGHSETTNNATFYGVVWLDPRNKPLTLLPLAGDVASLALGINDDTTVVGASLDANFSARAFIWQKGAAAPTDLNTLISGNPSLYLLLAESVNNRDEIVGLGATNAGDVHGFLAIPSGDRADNDAVVPMARPVLSDQSRQVIQRAFAQSYHGAQPR